MINNDPILVDTCNRSMNHVLEISNFLFNVESIVF